MGWINGRGSEWKCDGAGCDAIVAPGHGWLCDKCLKPKVADVVNRPPHYTSHPSKVECITVTEHMCFCLGNAMKYIWRADLKGKSIEDLEKAKWYIEREIAKRKATDAE